MRDDDLNLGKLFFAVAGLTGVSLFVAFLGLLEGTFVETVSGIAALWLFLSAVVAPLLFVQLREHFIEILAEFCRVLDPRQSAEGSRPLVVVETTAATFLAVGTVGVYVFADLFSGRHTMGGDSKSLADMLGWESLFGLSEPVAILVFVLGWFLLAFAWVFEGLRGT
ncbi:hypothetical protein [Haloarchaeobius sp. DFWS5]|uniref:hypothetical protein n=1 Tax=Haloarchaeobius sp. DFWS5 TaxID=3446114 RepID=UPI003EB99E9F